MSKGNPGIGGDHNKDLIKLRDKKGREIWKRLFQAGALLFFALLISAHFRSAQISTDMKVTLPGLYTANSLHAESFLEMRYWIESHGLKAEKALFEQLANNLSWILVQSSGRNHTLSLFADFVTGAGFRLGFILIACWRLWLIVVIVSFVSGLSSIKPHTGRDMLGMTGNGRLFYSGILARLKDFDAQGDPEIQIKGLACPECAPAATVEASSLGAFLKKKDLLNNTNLWLAGVIIAHRDHPPFLSFDAKETLALVEEFKAMPLEKHILRLLRMAFQTKELVKNGEQLTAEKPGTSSTENYYQQVETAMYRVLTGRNKEALPNIPDREIATVLLSMEASKGMVYSSDSGRWIKQSAFPHLTGRAILHAAPDLDREYDFSCRSRIRQALMYASRSSVFGPVRFPVGLSAEALALRQWTELMIALPDEMIKVSDKVELFGLSHEINIAWTKALLKLLEEDDGKLFAKSYATPFNIFFLPLGVVISILRTAVSEEKEKRLFDLIRRMAARQKKEAAAELSAEGMNDKIPEYERLLPGLSRTEIKKISSEHELDSELLRKWSYYRSVLNFYSWMARRVGDDTVPESSVVFTVFPATDKSGGGEKYQGETRMVPLRATRLVENFGGRWKEPFNELPYVNISADREGYERLLRGENAHIDDID